MAKERKKGWYYMDSAALNMEVAYNPERRIAMTEDLTVYTLEEIFLLNETSKTIPLEVHLIKNMCKGSIIEVK